jgi:uncharacterized protein (TIGR02598 family)
MKIRATSRQPRGRRNVVAFTLAEVMVAVAILGIMIVTVFSGFTVGWAIIHTSRDDLRATQILQQKIESIRLLTWDQLINQCPGSFLDYYNPSGQGNTAVGTVYHGTISIDPATSLVGSVSYNNQVRLVTVSVSWTNLSGTKPVAHSRQMQTLSAMNGLQNYIWGNHP